MRVLFFSQQRLWRDTLKQVFLNVPDMTFLPPVGTIEEAIESVLDSKPDVILIDLNPSLFVPLVVAELRRACPDCRIIALSSHADPIAEGQVAAEGMNGFLSKHISFDELVDALRAAASGRYIFHQINGSSIAPPDSNTGALTTREAQVLEQVAQGFANKQIADNLGISIKTVEKHRQRLMNKLQAHETASLTWRAVCLGASQPPAQS